MPNLQLGAPPPPPPPPPPHTHTHTHLCINPVVRCKNCMPAWLRFNSQLRFTHLYRAIILSLCHAMVKCTSRFSTVFFRDSPQQKQRPVSITADFKGRDLCTCLSARNVAITKIKSLEDFVQDQSLKGLSPVWVGRSDFTSLPSPPPV